MGLAHLSTFQHAGPVCAFLELKFQGQFECYGIGVKGNTGFIRKHGREKALNFECVRSPFKLNPNQTSGWQLSKVLGKPHLFPVTARNVPVDHFPKLQVASNEPPTFPP